jgi:ketosteroid isomerase-like protein
MNKVYPTLLALAGLIGCTQTAIDSDTATDEAAIREHIAQTAAANNAADTLGWVELFEDGAVYMPPGAPEVTTRAGLQEMAASGFGPYAADIQITPAEIVISGDWAFARSYVTGTVTPRAGGEAIRVDVKQIVIYHRQPDSSWKIARMINNRNS